MTIAVTLTGAFKQYRKRLSSQRDDAVIVALREFMANPKQRSLNFELVTGHKGYFTIRSSLVDRVLLRRVGPQAYEAVAVGNHDLIYGAYFRR